MNIYEIRLVLDNKDISEITLKENVKIRTDDNIKMIGKTKNYLFLFNKESKDILVQSVSEIKSIYVFDKK